MWDPGRRARLAALFDELVPGSAPAGAVEYVEQLLGALDHDPPRLWAGLDGWIEPGVWEVHAWRARIDAWRAAYERLSADDGTAADRRVAYEHACEATYGDPGYGGNRGGAGWQAIAFPRPRQPPSFGTTTSAPETLLPRNEVDEVDVVVVGSGPGGATVAEVCSAAGWSVLVLEKGRNHLLDLAPPYAPLRHFANDEVGQVRRRLLGPDALLEPRTYRRAAADGDRLLTGEVNNLPSTVGGGGVHADAKLPRFREEDFRLLSERGPVDGAAVADWPITYDDLEPHYAAVERAFGVAGEEGNPFAARRSGPFPMPPGADMPMAVVSAAAAERAGLHPYRAPTGANSVEYDGRPACIDCGFCGGYGCPVHAKGDPIAALQRALRSGRCEIRPDAHVTEIVLDRARRRAVGVRYLDLRSHPSPPLVEVRAARAVVLAAGAFETARLLLGNGLGGDLVGRHLTYHFQTFTVGVFPEPTGGERGRSVTHLHDDFMVDGPALRGAARAAGLPWLRGGVVEHGAGPGPIEEALTYPTGAHHTASMADSALRRRLWVFTMQGEDLPQAVNRVDLDPSVRDVWGRPAGRVTYSPHRHELAASDHVAPIHEAVLMDAGAELAFSATSPPTGDLDVHAELSPLGIAPASRHVMGTCRMGTDPATSVVSPEQQVWGVDGLFVCDSSVFVTSSGYNPTLTLAALAHRAAGLLTGRQRR